MSMEYLDFDEVLDRIKDEYRRASDADQNIWQFRMNDMLNIMQLSGFFIPNDQDQIDYRDQVDPRTERKE